MARKCGRPLTPLDPTASCNARLGYELRTCRQDEELTLEQLADRIGFTPQRISDVERAKATPSQPFLAACEDALHAAGKLLALLPDAQRERDEARQARADARRKARQAKSETALPCDATHCEAGDNEDVEPTDRRGLLGAGAAAALGLSGVTATPAQARGVDPELPAHSVRLLCLLGRLDVANGPQDVLDSVLYELRLIVKHRETATGGLRSELMRVEARWAGLAGWLSADAGRPHDRDVWTARALQLAKQAGFPDMIAYARTLQSRFALQDRDSRRAVALATDALRVPGISQQTRALCARQTALGHALAGDAASCERSIADAYRLLEHVDSPAPPWASASVTHRHVRAGEAHCLLWLKPSKAVPLYESILSEWPRERMRDGGLHQARLARAYAATGELDRAREQGRKAFAVAQATKSITIERELQRLTAELRAA